MGSPVVEGGLKTHIPSLPLAEEPFMTLDFIEFGKKLGIGTAGFW